MENNVQKGFITMVFLMSCFVALGQQADDLDLTHIYNKWVFSPAESSNSIQVYRNEDFFEDVEVRSQRWRFAAHSDVFVNFLYPKNRSRVIRRCGNDSRPQYNRPTRTKGRWELVEENGVTFLLLHYYGAKKGKPFQLVNTVRYLVIHLGENLMELKIINRKNVG